MASPPRAAMRPTVASASRPLPSPCTLEPRSFTTIRAPCRANSSACARPMPCPAPVTIATLPSNSPTCTSSDCIKDTTRYTSGVHGILGFGAYVPYPRLDLSTVAPVAGSGGGQGERAVASYDEDATTMAVEAARIARQRTPDVRLESVWLATVSP